MSEEFLSAERFWAELQRCGMETTDSYTADGNARFCKRKDGQVCVVSVHDTYPAYIVDKVLIENGFMDMPLYTNLN